MSPFRRCSRPGCGKPAVATLTYAYAESTAVVQPLASVQEPHSWDLCAQHSENITAPVGWELVRVEDVEIEDEDDLFALAQAVREEGRVTSGLVGEDAREGDDPIQHDHSDHADPDTSAHPVFRRKRIANENKARRAHLRVVRSDSAD